MTKNDGKTPLFAQFISSSDSERLFNQESFLLAVTERICEVMADNSVSRATLADLLGKSRSHVSQLLDGTANMTIRTLADIGFALKHVPAFDLVPMACAPLESVSGEDAGTMKFLGRVPLSETLLSAEDNEEDEWKDSCPLPTQVPRDNLCC